MTSDNEAGDVDQLAESLLRQLEGPGSIPRTTHTGASQLKSGGRRIKSSRPFPRAWGVPGFEASLSETLPPN